MEEQLEGHKAPSGSYIVLEARVDGVDLVFVGYKYNRRKVIFCVMTKGAAPTTPGKPYIARWSSGAGNIQTRNVRRPECFHRLFGNANNIDAHNQLRQDSLGLEKQWPTFCPWTKVVLTLIGICVIDALRATRYMLRNNTGMSSYAYMVWCL